MTILSATKEIEVCFSDVDSLSIVWHGRYVRYFEDAREYFGKKHDFSYLTFYQKGYMLPLVDIQLSYKKMVSYGELLKIKVTYVPTRAVKLIFKYEIFDQSGEIVCIGKSVQVVTTTDRKLVLTPPQFMTDWASKWLNQKHHV